jgi:O-antigen/teichoic acid export membrane protein
MSVSKKLISNAVYLFADWFVLTLMSFVYWLIAGKTLLPQEYGVVSTSVNLATLLSGISLLGLNSAVWKLIPEYLARKQKGKVNSLIRFSLKATILSSLAFLFVLILLYPFLSSILKVSQTVIFLAAITLFILSLSSQLGMIIYGFQDMKKIFLTDFCGQIAKVSISAILIFSGFSYFGPLLGFLFGTLVLSLLRFSPISFKGKTGKINKKEIFFNYALPAFIASLAWIIFVNGQYVLLTILKNPEVTGIFTIAMLLTSPIIVMPQVLTQALLPIISQLSIDHNSKAKQSYLIQLVFRYSLFISLPAALFLIIFSKQVILIVSRAEYLPASQLFPILAFASIIYGLGNVFLSNLYAIGETKLNRNIVILTTVTFFLIAVPLIKHYSAFGLSIAYFFAVTTLSLLSFFFMKKFLKITLPWKNLWKIVIASSISFSFLYFAVSLTSGLLIGIIFAIIAGIIYLAVLIPLRFYSKEDVETLEFISAKLPLFKKQISFLIKFLSRYTA